MRYFLFLLALFFGCQKRQEPLSTPFFPVKIAVAEKKEVPIYIESLGHVEPIISVEIRSRIEGELTGVYFKQGQEVKKGDLLFTIDPKPYEATLNQQKGKLSQTKANLILAEEKVKRYQGLVQEEFYSQIDYESLQASYATNLGALEEIQAEVDRASIDLDYCWIYAPIDGMLGILQIDLGNLVRADGEKPLITLNQMKPIFVTFSIPEIQLHRIQKWSKNSDLPLKVLAAHESFDQPYFEGTLSIMDNSVDPKTGMIKLRATFENGENGLWPGQFVRTRLILYTEKGAILIPQSAVQPTANGPIAFVVGTENCVELRKLKLGERLDNKVIVLEGIEPGETVVAEGQMNLFDGARVSFKGER